MTLSHIDEIFSFKKRSFTVLQNKATNVCMLAFKASNHYKIFLLKHECYVVNIKFMLTVSIISKQKYKVEHLLSYCRESQR